MKFEWIDIVNFKLKGKDYFTIWYEKDEMGFLKEENSLMVFNSSNEANSYIEENIDYDSREIPVIIYDIDNLKMILDDEEKYLETTEILDFWNISMDLSSTLSIDFKGDLHGREVNSIYDKLFFGENMDIFNPTDEVYVPDFTDEEIDIMEDIIREAIDIIEDVFSKE